MFQHLILRLRIYRADRRNDCSGQNGTSLPLTGKAALFGPDVGCHSSTTCTVVPRVFPHFNSDVGKGGCRV
ncbi:uncharacterized protein ACO6RY_05916 [Pungitius sinensis]